MNNTFNNQSFIQQFFTLESASGILMIINQDLFIGSLAFEETGSNLLLDERIGILAGSLLSGITGCIVLHKALPAIDTKQ